jgi:nickel transport system substrate-binding protein
VNVGPLNPHLYTPNQMFAQSMVYEPLVKYQADGSAALAGDPLASLRRW